MGIFKGLSGIFGGGSAAPSMPFIPQQKLIIGHVLEVCTDSRSRLYKGSDTNLGNISFREVYSAPIQEVGKEKGITAKPLDRSNFKVPLPGEQVLVYQLYSDTMTPSNVNAPAYYYTSPASVTANVTANTSPFIGIDPWMLNPFNFRQLTYDQMTKRFDKKIKNLTAFKGIDSKPIIHKQLRPGEGDFILQGRFGNGIKFAGTPTAPYAKDFPWSTKKKGKPGDPITIMRLSSEVLNPKQAAKQLCDVEDINEDAASVYMTSTQEVPIELAVPEKGDLAHPLASWAHSYNIEPFDTGAGTASKKGKKGGEEGDADGSKKGTGTQGDDSAEAVSANPSGDTSAAGEDLGGQFINVGTTNYVSQQAKDQTVGN